MTHILSDLFYDQNPRKGIRIRSNTGQAGSIYISKAKWTYWTPLAIPFLASTPSPPKGVLQAFVHITPWLSPLHWECSDRAKLQPSIPPKSANTTITELLQHSLLQKWDPSFPLLSDLNCETAEPGSFSPYLLPMHGSHIAPIVHVLLFKLKTHIQSILSFSH